MDRNGIASQSFEWLKRADSMSASLFVCVFVWFLFVWVRHECVCVLRKCFPCSWSHEIEKHAIVSLKSSQSPSSSLSSSPSLLPTTLTVQCMFCRLQTTVATHRFYGIEQLDCMWFLISRTNHGWMYETPTPWHVPNVFVLFTRTHMTVRRASPSSRCIHTSCYAVLIIVHRTYTFTSDWVRVRLACGRNGWKRRAKIRWG